ncbi:MAG TPA: Gfo/Idh/MocA family oxidoreductase [Clostridia bacterium]|jgi:UDP-N-acetyl-2-amino-2-deoxyglucuronate dehydrogenase
MKCGIIGCGAVSLVHIEGVLEAGAKIEFLCDIVKERAEFLKNKYSLDCKIYTDYLDAIRETSVDCVHICTPHYLHKEMTIAALERDINVLCEKPLCINLKEGEEIKEALKRSKAQLGVCFQNRYLPANRYVKELADKIKINSAFCSLAWSRDVDYYVKSGWRGQKEKEGGGVLINQAIHTLDLLIWFLGEPKVLYSQINNHHLKDIISVEDTAQIYLEFENARSLFFATTASPVNNPVLIAMKGADKETAYNIMLYPNNNEVYLNGKKIELEEVGTNAYRDYWGAGHKLIIEDFYDSIANNRHFKLDFEEGIKTIKILDQVYNSNCL